MKRKLLSAALLAVSALGFHANAQDTYPQDMTSKIINPGIDGNSNGWTAEKPYGGGGPMKPSNDALEFWAGSANPRSSASFNYYQTITGLPAGKYTVSADMFNSTNGETVNGEYGVFSASSGVYATNSSNVTVKQLVNVNDRNDDNNGDKQELIKYTTEEINVIDGILIIGVKNFEKFTAQWFVADNFTLTLTAAPDLSDYVDAYEKALEGAKGVDQSKTMAASIKEALNRAIATYSSVDEASIEELETAIAALNEVKNKANTSIASYETIASGTVRTDVLDGWTCTNSNLFQVNKWSTEDDASGMKTPFIENWRGSGDNKGLDEGVFSYTIECLEPGEVYYAQAFIRSYNERNTEVPNGPNFFINDKETDLASEGTPFVYNNGQKDMSGIYATLGAFATVREDGTLTLGAKIANDANYNWVAFKNVSIQTASAAYASAKANAEAVDVTQPMNSDVRSAYNSTFATYGTEPSSTQEYETAIQALNDAAAAANASITAYSKMKGELDRVYNEVSTTNVYTADAYKANYTDKLEAWTNETISTEEASAYTFGSRVTGAGPAILLSAWDVADGSLYINTWSIENAGSGDAADFATPFFEYYVDDNSTLAAKTMTATVAGLEASTQYAVSAQVRVRQRNKADTEEDGANAKVAESITLQVGEGELVDVTAGKQISDQPRYIATYTAAGTTDASGNLTITIDVKENSNISWLSFKNMNYFVAASSSDYAALNSAITSAESEAESKTLGFEAGEYAPYNNATVIKALIAAKAIDQDAINSKEDVQAVIDALTSAEWVANEEEVNAVYDGNFAIAPISAASGDADKDITWWTTTNSMRKVFDSTEENCAQIASSTSGKGLFVWNGSCSYGKIEGYTMPLAAHTIYELNVKYAGWQTGAVNNFTVSVSDANETVISKNLGTANGINTTLASTGKLLFTTGDAGDYTLTISGSGNFIFTDVTLYKAPATQTVEVSAAGYATFSSEYPLDLSNIEDGTAYIVADDAEGEYIKLTEQTEAVPANTGLIIAGEGTVTIPVVATANPLEKENYLVAVSKYTEVESGYVLGWDGNDPTTVGFYVVDKTPAPVKAGQAYLELPSSEEEAAGIKVLRFAFGDEIATAIETAEVADADADGAIYNVAGQQVGKDYKGIVIKNGKKYLNK